MTFLAPILLIGLILVPILAGLYVLVQRRRSRYAVRFTNLDLLANLAPRRPAWRRHVPAALYLGAVGALVFALARPTMVLAVPREDATVVMAIDISGSMRATDVSPTRLAAAQAAAQSFLDQLPPEIRVAIVSFSSETHSLLPPTTDRESAKSAIASLRPENGTAMGDALTRVLDIAQSIQDADAAAGKGSGPGSTGATPAPSSDPNASPAPNASGGVGTDQPSNQPLVAAILLSDGANTTGETDPLQAADRAASMDVPIFTIALGTDQGVVDVPDQNGQPTTLQVPPDRETLAKIAETTDAIAFDAPTATDLQAVYDNLQSRIGYTEHSQEVTAAFAGAALLLVVAAAGLSAFWFGRLP
jgi:Ca-activated chloride channel homolog